MTGEFGGFLVEDSVDLGACIQVIGIPKEGVDNSNCPVYEAVGGVILSKDLAGGRTGDTVS